MSYYRHTDGNLVHAVLELRATLADTDITCGVREHGALSSLDIDATFAASQCFADTANACKRLSVRENECVRERARVRARETERMRERGTEKKIKRRSKVVTQYPPVIAKVATVYRHSTCQ